MRGIDRVVVEALQQAGAVYVRSNKHHIFRLPNGRAIVVAATPGDHRSNKNVISVIRRTAVMERQS